MNAKQLVKEWFEKWQEGDFHHLPLSDHFSHTSPFGTIKGKQNYFNMVEANKDKFLHYHFQIHDQIYEEDRACVRYTAAQFDFNLEVSEWYYIKDGLIEKIIAYYHIGEIREDRTLTVPEDQ